MMCTRIILIYFLYSQKMLRPRYHIGQKVTYLDSRLCPKSYQYDNENNVDNYYYGGAYDDLIGYVGEVVDIKMDEEGANHLEYDVSIDDVGNTYSMRDYEFEEYYDIFPEDVQSLEAYVTSIISINRKGKCLKK